MFKMKCDTAKAILIVCVLWSGFVKDAAGLNERDPCTTNEGFNGLCTGYSKCKTKNEIKKIVTCGFADQLLICCPQSATSSTFEVSQKIDDDNSNDRISVKKCNKYKQINYKTFGITSLVHTPQVYHFSDPGCEHTVELIVGGKAAKVGEFPHMAAIGYPDIFGQINFKCGGSLISEFYVLTAGHCVADEEFPAKVVRLGEQNLASENDGAHPEDYQIAEIIKHPDYKPKQGSYNDIALFKLNREVFFTKSIRPACLWPSLSINQTRAVACGFGQTEFADGNSEELLKVTLDIHDKSKCSSQYAGDKKLREGIKDSQLCVGYLPGGKDTCGGDSGGPLQIALPGNQCNHYLIGVTSLGRSCGSRDSLSLYTKVASYLDWIESIAFKK